MENAKDEVYKLLSEREIARNDPKALEYFWLVTNNVIDPNKCPYYKYLEVPSVATVLRIRRKLIEDGDIFIDKSVEALRRHREEQVKKAFSRKHKK